LVKLECPPGAVINKRSITFPFHVHTHFH
jgi:hypothetical protein